MVLFDFNYFLVNLPCKCLYPILYLLHFPWSDLKYDGLSSSWLLLYCQLAGSSDFVECFKKNQQILYWRFIYFLSGIVSWKFFYADLTKLKIIVWPAVQKLLGKKKRLSLETNSSKTELRMILNPDKVERKLILDRKRFWENIIEMEGT